MREAVAANAIRHYGVGAATARKDQRGCDHRLVIGAKLCWEESCGRQGTSPRFYRLLRRRGRDPADAGLDAHDDAHLDVATILGPWPRARRDRMVRNASSDGDRQGGPEPSPEPREH